MVKTDSLPSSGSRAVRPLRVPTPVPLQAPARPPSVASTSSRNGPRSNKNVPPSSIQYLQQYSLSRPPQPTAKVAAEALLRCSRTPNGISNGGGSGVRGSCNWQAGRSACVERVQSIKLMRSAIPVRVACQQQQPQHCCPAPGIGGTVHSVPYAAQAWVSSARTSGKRHPPPADHRSTHSYAPLFTTNRSGQKLQNGPFAACSALMPRHPRKEPPRAESVPLSLAMATSFHRTLQGQALVIPPALLRGLERRENTALGRVKVMLRIAPSVESENDGGSFMEIDPRQKQLTVYQPDSSLGPAEERRVGVSAPKMFAFDAIFSPDDSQDRVCSKSLGDVLPAVVNGSDACVFSYGYSKLGKSRTMIGGSDSTQDLGIVPSAISWLFRMIHEQRQKTGARFSVRVSATEIAGKTEVLRDLLASYANGTEGCLFSPAQYLKEDPVFGLHLQNQSELRAPSADKAAFYLDAALAASRAASRDVDGVTHFIFTLHVYQYRVEKSGIGGVAGGRSRLYLVDLGGCEKQSQVFASSKSYRLSLANLGNVILAIFNGQKHVPYKDSKLTQLLREILGNITCRATMIAHISPLAARYTDSLATVQLASRIHRLRHKKWKNMHNGCGDGSVDDPIRRFHRRDGPRSSSSDVDCTSSSEQSCDTVIFVGPREKTLHEGVEVEPPALPVTAPLVPVPKPSYAQIRRMTASQQPTPSSGRCLVERPPFAPYVTQCGAQESVVEGPPSKLRPVQCVPGRNAPCEPDATMVTPTRPSDEFWVDGPRVNRSNFEAFRTEWMFGNLGVGSVADAIAGNGEMWVDGPQAPTPQTRRLDLHFLDEHKRAMIERWIEMQTSAIRQQRRSVGSDDSVFVAEDPAVGLDILDDAKADTALKEVEVVSNVDSFVSGETEELDRSSCDAVQQLAELGGGLAPCRSSVSGDYEQAEFYRRVMLHVSELSDGTTCNGLFDGGGDESTTSGSSDNASSDGGLQASTMDSWVQVTEEEILLACRSLLVDDDHPLRILSSESLAVSFTNSSRMSWDSGLNAMRRALAAVAAGAPIGVAGPQGGDVDPYLGGQCPDFDAHSDPGSVSSHRILASALAKNEFGSRSLDDLSDLTNGTFFAGTSRRRRLDCCNDAASDTCSCNDCCSECDFGLLRFCPDGASDPHLDRHPSAPDLVADDGRGMLPLERKFLDATALPNSGRHCPEVDLGDGPKENVLLPQVVVPVPPRVNVDVSKLKSIVRADSYCAKAEVRATNRNGSAKAATTAFCCAVGLSRHAPGGSSSGSESSKFKGSSIKTPGFRCRISPCKLDTLVAKESFCSDSERPQTEICFEDSCGPRKVPLSPPPVRLTDEKRPQSPSTTDQKTADDKVSYDSGTGTGSSSGGSMSSGGKEEAKKHASLGTSSGYESIPRGSEGSGSLMSNQDSVSLSSDEMTSSLKEAQQPRCGASTTPAKECRAASGQHGVRLGSFELIAYDAEDVERIERRRELEKSLRQRRRRSKIMELRRRQEELKKELALAKSLIMADPCKWSYDLHVEESMDAADPSFIEALQQETEILEKRVTACKSHIAMVTCFDAVAPTNSSSLPSTEAAETTRYEDDNADTVMSL